MKLDRLSFQLYFSQKNLHVNSVDESDIDAESLTSTEVVDDWENGSLPNSSTETSPEKIRKVNKKRFSESNEQIPQKKIKIQKNPSCQNFSATPFKNITNLFKNTK